LDEFNVKEEKNDFIKGTNDAYLDVDG